MHLEKVCVKTILSIMMSTKGQGSVRAPQMKRGFPRSTIKGVQEWHTKVIKSVYVPSAPIRNVSAVIFWECFHNVNDFWDASRKESL